MCAKCASSWPRSRRASLSRFLLSRTSFYLFLTLSVTCLPNDRFGCRPHCNLLSLFVSGRTGCAPPNAPYVEYTDERGQVTSAACPRHVPPRHDPPRPATPRPRLLPSSRGALTACRLLTPSPDPHSELKSPLPSIAHSCTSGHGLKCVRSNPTRISPLPTPLPLFLLQIKNIEQYL